MPLGNPIRKQNESRMVSVLATEGQTVFTVQGGYIINHISVFRNGVRLSPAEDFTAGDGSTVTLNNAANIDDRIDFHIFDRFTVQNAIIGAASTQTINGDLVLNGKLFGQLDVPSINLTGIITATQLDLNGSLDVSSTSVFNDDVTFTGAAANITFDKSEDDLVFGDNAKAVFGTGGDLEIYHSSSNSFIRDVGTGVLSLDTNGSAIRFRKGTSETLAMFNTDGAVELFYDGTIRLETTPSGADITGTLNVTGVSTFTGNVSMGGGNLILGDSGGSSDDRIQIGASQDLSLYHNGASSYIDNTGGSLFIKSSNQVYIQDDQGRKQITCVDGAAVELYHAGVDSVRLQTTTTGVSVPTLNVTGISTFIGNVSMGGGNLVFGDSGGATDDRLTFGAGTDLSIYHGSNISTIIDTYGDLRIMGNTIRIQRQAGGENFLYMTEGGTVRLHYDGIERLETTSAGAQIFNTLEVGNTNAPFLIESTTSGGGTEDIGRIGINRTNASTSDRQLWLQYTVGASDAYAAFMARSANDTGTAGTFLKIDAVNNNVDLPRDNEKLQIGASGDLQIYHDGNSKIQNVNNSCDFRLISNSIELKSQSGDEYFQKCTVDGAVSLYHDNVEKLATFSQGVDVIVSGNSGLRIRGNVADVNPRLVFRRKNNDGNNSEPAAIEMSYVAGTTHESGHLDFFTNGDSGSAALNRRVRIRNDGQILINTTTLTSLGSQTGANNVVTVNKSGICLTAYSVVAGFYYDRINYTNSQYYVVNSSGTGVYLGNGSTSWSANSDERLKINITELDGTKAYNHVKTARATSFNWNATGHPTDKKIGFIAQEWETNYPEVVSTSTDTVDSVENPKGIRYTETVPVLMAALKEAISKIEALETKVAALEGS